MSAANQPARQHNHAVERVADMLSVDLKPCYLSQTGRSSRIPCAPA